MQPNLFSRQPPSFRSFVIAVITCLVVLFFDWRMPYVVKPARDVLYAAYNPIYALASYPVLSREWLNQQTKSEAQLRRENTAMQAELLQAQVRLQKLSELSAENNRLRGLLDTPLIIDGRMQIAEVIGTDADPQFELGHFTRVFEQDDLSMTQGFWLYVIEDGVYTP